MRELITPIDVPTLWDSDLWQCRQWPADDMSEICRIAYDRVIEQMLPTVSRRIRMPLLPSANIPDDIQPVRAQLRHVAE